MEDAAGGAGRNFIWASREREPREKRGIGRVPEN